jgi:hypothetical protein
MTAIADFELELVAAIVTTGVAGHDDPRAIAGLVLEALRRPPASIAPACPPVDVGVAAQEAAEAHLAACWAAHDAQDDGGVLPSPATGPFDGCETCCVREILAAAWPVFLAFERP